MKKSEQAYRINITNPKYCLILSDTTEGVSYGEVKDFGEAQEVQITPSYASGQLYGNGVVVDSTALLTGLSVAFSNTKIPIEVRAEIYNQKFENGVLDTKGGVVPKEFAFGYEVEQSNGKSEFVWLLKGKPKPMNRGVKQSENNINYSTDKMEIDFMPRKYDKSLKYEADLSNSDFTEEQAKAWFISGPSNPPKPSETVSEEANEETNEATTTE